MKTMQQIKKVITTAALALTMLAPTAATAETKASVEGLATRTSETTYARPNLWLNLPGKIDSWTWIEIYQDGQGYYGQTYLTRGLGKGISARAELIHDNTPLSMAGVGAQYDFKMPENSYAGIKIIPAWFTKDGLVNDRIIAGYYLGTELKHGILLGTFGQANIANGEWDYGEISAMKKIGNHLEAGYNGALKLNGTGKLAPTLEHRLAVNIKF